MTQLGELLSQCAESKVHACTLGGGATHAIAKIRPSKPYRQPQLDNHLRKSRTSAESRMLQKCEKLNIRAPLLLSVDSTAHVIYMERLNGVTAKEWLMKNNENKEEEVKSVCRRMGTLLAKLHDNDIIHGDLTTSNFMVLEGIDNEVAVIDFGLAMTSASAEDRAVDLYVLERALSATHPGSEQMLASIQDGYNAQGDPTRMAATLKKLENKQIPMSLDSALADVLRMKFTLKDPRVASLNPEDEFTADPMDTEHRLDVARLPICPNPSAIPRIDFKKGTTTLGFRFEHGIVVAVDSRASTGQYVASQTVQKVLEINEFMLGTMAGGAADCQFWFRVITQECRLWELRHGTRITIAAASKILANITYSYRSKGLSMGSMIAGYDNLGSHLYYVDDQGDRIKHDVFSVGSGSVFAYGVLDSGYSFNMSAEAAIDLARRSIYHATHRDAFSGGYVSVYHITKSGWKKVSRDDQTDLHKAYGREGLNGETC